MNREYKEIVADDLQIGDSFILSPILHRSTVFVVDGLGHMEDIVEVICADDDVLSLIAKANRLVYLVAPEPTPISVTELTVGDRYSTYAEASEIFTVVSVDDGNAHVSTTPTGEWLWIGIEGGRYHTYSTGEYVATVYRHVAEDYLDQRLGGKS